VDACLDVGQSSVCRICWHSPQLARSFPMMDIILVATGLAFFALSIGYVFACDRL
jgi:hypothetical protein